MSIALRGFILFFAGTLSLPITANGATFKTLHAFCSESNCQDGALPQSSVTLDPAGNLYGTTQLGGARQEGAVYELKLATSGKFKRLYSFCNKGGGCLRGAYPESAPIVDASGKLYGTASAGGPQRGGLIFELTGTDSTRQFEILHRFCRPDLGCPDGDEPRGDKLTYQGAASGAPYDGVSPLYGTTWGGTVFELQPSAGGTKWKLTVLYSFCMESNCADGTNPVAGLLLDSRGNLYGTTQFGGANDEGTVFRLSSGPKGWTYRVIHDFCGETNCNDGREPAAPLLMDAAGNLLGTAQNGGPNNGGVFFKLAPHGKHYRYSIVHNFCLKASCRDGARPAGEFAMDAAGNIFGSTQAGGPGDPNNGGAGVIYELSGRSLHVLYSFCRQDDCPDGEDPLGIARDSNGNLYGATMAGGLGIGTVFELTP